MDKCKTLIRRALWIGLMLAVLMVAGCSGIKPYKPRNYRQEGLEKGVYTGTEGEFVIYRKAGEPETVSEDGKRSGEIVDDEQQNTDSEKKNKDNRSDEQKP